MKFPFNPFSRKEDSSKLKENPIPEAKRQISKDVMLYSVNMGYNKGRREGRQFVASIVYKENPDNYMNPGITYEEEMIAQDWSELIDKVSNHFSGNKNA